MECDHTARTPIRPRGEREPVIIGWCRYCGSIQKYKHGDTFWEGPLRESGTAQLTEERDETAEIETINEDTLIHGMIDKIENLLPIG